VGEPIPGGRLDDPALCVERFRRTLGGVVRVSHATNRRGEQSDDVGITGGQA
jgi:hypothetical protein